MPYYTIISQPTAALIQSRSIKRINPIILDDQWSVIVNRVYRRRLLVRSALTSFRCFSELRSLLYRNRSFTSDRDQRLYYRSVASCPSSLWLLVFVTDSRHYCVHEDHTNTCFANIWGSVRVIMEVFEITKYLKRINLIILLKISYFL